MNHSIIDEKEIEKGGGRDVLAADFRQTAERSEKGKRKFHLPVSQAADAGAD